jgi:glycosyltransferase involved in cell wall biosynthesis
MPKKIACIFSFQKSSWVSCQKIVFNLHQCYQSHSDFQLSNFNYGAPMTPGEIELLAKKIIAEEPDMIVVLDHKPHPLPLFQWLLMEYKSIRKKPRIVFHLFGDFTLYYAEWGKLAELLKGFAVDFIVASGRQKILIDKFLLPHHETSVCPFPVNPDEFFYQPMLREQQRQNWGRKDNDTVFVFTGRLSRQKRIHTLIQTFGAALEASNNKNCHLYLYGNPDHIGDNFLGIWETENEYFRKIYRLYEQQPEHIRSRIHFMGSVPNAELIPVYQAADMLVNLSVHNDEDYGMSVAEAQAAGLPAILTDWGGLAGFEHPELPGATSFIPVKIGSRSKLISYSHVTRALKDHMQTMPVIDRSTLSALAISRFGLGGTTKQLEAILDKTPQPFAGFNDFFGRASALIQLSQTPYISPTKKIKPIYREIYSAYVRDNQETV